MTPSTLTHHRPATRYALRGLLALSLLLLAMPAAAYEIWEIHTAGPFGGMIRVDGDFIKIPGDACGLRWDPAVEWHWGTSAGSPTITGSGDTLTVFGGSLSGCGGAYEFHTPVNAGTGPSDNVLVAQAWPSDIEWLDGNGQPLGGDDPPPVDICEVIYGGCGGGSLRFLGYCEANPRLCGGIEIFVPTIVQLLEMSHSVDSRLREARGLLAEPVSSTRDVEIDRNVASAQESLAETSHLLATVAAARDEMVDTFDSGTSGFLTVPIATATSALSLGDRGLAACATELDRLDRLSRTPTAAELDDAIEACGVAHSSLGVARDAAAQARGMGIAAETDRYQSKR